ncbi:hypothetical protein [Candidatus Hecatella orcuttiae]|jgi:hypothetical protein|uniref:hypothetical protein n=1 Tax=Candidatus Hecatella orcuttiae TaxID=1935119 RepID=UPI002867F85C|nr:hypothetical protein [Candidatus Hecatella orcuttiae]
MDREWYRKKVRESQDFGDLFEVVKKSVLEVLGHQRAGLMLYLADLPLYVGAYHGVNSNTIVVNRALLRLVREETESAEEMNSFVYVLLLHEYLHSLGFVDETQVKNLARRVALETLGEEHPAAKASQDPYSLLKRRIPLDTPFAMDAPELVKDFDRQAQRYFV